MKSYVLISGATGGLGKAFAAECSARALALRGAHVIGVGHSEQRCRDVQSAILAELPTAHILHVVADLSSQHPVMQLAEDIRTAASVSGGGKLDVLINNAGYSVLKSYKQSKLANVLFTAEFNRRVGGTGVRAYAADPGLVNTSIGLKGTGGLARTVWQWRSGRGASPEAAAETLVFSGDGPIGRRLRRGLLEGMPAQGSQRLCAA